ncbi:MAG: glycoside hydrolase family 127 protein [Ignavibacteriales bacterium]|nr:glycoside hydrolase family 127 protein [Ignavibacteriales bacterium]
MNNKSFIFLSILFFSLSCSQNKIIVKNVDLPDTTSVNKFYVNNKNPLIPNSLIKLPIGSVKPNGWIKESLQRQADGLLGNLSEISAWLQKEDNAWLSENGSGEWGWEEVPYWLKGYSATAFILNNEKMLSESQIWFEAVFKSQREDGNFGPYKISEKDSTQDFWPNMIMLYCLQSYYEFTNDQRVIELMTKYFKYQFSLPDDKFLSAIHYWQRIRGGDNLNSILWLYNHTGDEFLLDLAEKNHRVTAPWNKRGNRLEEIKNWKSKRDNIDWPSWYGDLIDWHNVNIAQCFREPAEYYLISKNKNDLNAAYDNFKIIREHFGQVPGGMYGADENARPGYDDPRQGIETCGIVEQMNSNENLLRITGDIFWADHTEDVLFNTFPAAFMPDFKSLRYITSPNMILNDDKNHSPGIQNNGPFLLMNPFSSRCCQHNHGQGLPYFIENMWMATPDNGIAAVLYSANTVTAKVGNGNEIKINCATNYPFDENLIFEISTENNVEFPLYFRIPQWCKNPSVTLNDQKLQEIPKAGKFLLINKVWKNGDKVILTLPKNLLIRTWEKNHNSISVDYGPLTFSLKIAENYIQNISDKTATSDSKWQKTAEVEKWPTYEIHPNSAWNYGLILDSTNIEKSFTIENRNWPSDNFPFTIDSSPIIIKAKGKRIPAWKIDEYGLAGELQNSPVKSSEAIEDIKLIPMGAARLRISSFPVIGNDSTANVWK